MSQTMHPPPAARGTERCVLRGEYPALATLATWCADLARAHQLAPGSALALDLCLTELVTNVIDYAYPAADPAHIAVDADPTEGALVVTLWDAGPAFNPLEHAAPIPAADLSEVRIGGLGIELVRKFASELSYARVGNWNRLRFTPNG